MDLKTLSIVFTTVFLAELGDKTQLATLLFAANSKHSAWGVFLASSLALICAAGLGVLAGSYLSQHINTRMLSIIAGIGFVAIGGWTLFAALRSA
jgi:putative Ca2+/H+ antiporter (TMEM165/GDT1 family)